MWRRRISSDQALLIPDARRFPSRTIKVGAASSIRFVSDPRIKNLIHVPTNECLESFTKRTNTHNPDYLASPPPYSRNGPAFFQQMTCLFDTGSSPSSLSALFVEGSLRETGYQIPQVPLRTLMGFVESNWDLLHHPDFLGKTVVCLRKIRGNGQDLDSYPAYVPDQMSFRSLRRHKGSMRTTDLILAVVPR